MNRSQCTFSILFPEKQIEFQMVPPRFFQDLQLEGILKAVTSKYMDFDIRKYFYTIPGSADTIRFRQKIYKDIENNPFLVTAFKQYIYRIQKSEICFGYYKQVEDTIKKGSYLLLTCQNYLEALQELTKALKKADIASEGLCDLQKILEEMSDEEEFTEFQQMVMHALSYMEQMKLTLLVKDSELSVLEYDKNTEKGICEQIQDYLKLFDIEPEQKDTVVRNIFPAPLETCTLENTIIDILQKSQPRIFEVLKKFASCGFSLSDNMFFALKNEILFYLCFYEFEQQLNEVGYALSFPQICEGESMELQGVYDAALAWKNRFSDCNVVKNDIRYQEGKSFLVITGPNQGGKTTLARAVGQCVYFMLIGLKAPCHFMKCRFFESILTHFEVEESVETGAGKLKEELQQLKPMMQDDLSGTRKNNFVILNELFTTATTYDARIMAQKVMKHFIENECLGIYVTHIQELADETSQRGVQSMVAQLDAKDPSIRTFKILPMEAKGLGYSDSIVRKYELDFEHVTARINDL